MLSIDYRFNIDKSKKDFQMMKLELYNVNIEDIKNGIIYMYDINKKIIKEQECQKFYFNNDCVEFYFMLDDSIEIGNYFYDIVIILKDGTSIAPLTERGFNVNV